MKSFLESLVSEQTRRSYKRGLTKFEEYYGKSPKFLLKEKDPAKTIEKFYVWLQKKYSQNSCKALVNPLQSLRRRSRIKAKGRFGWHIARKLFLRVAAENGVTSWNAKLMVGKAVDKSIATYINGVQLRKDFVKISNVLRMDEPQPNAKIPSLEEAVELVMEVQKQELLEKVKKLWNEKYGKFAGPGTRETIGLLIRQPDFENMSPKELLKEYLELLKEK